MHRKYLTVFGIGLVLVLLILPVFSKAEEEVHRLILVREMAIKPGMVAQFRNLMKESVAKAKEYKYSYSWSTWNDGNFHYYMLMPVKDRTDIVPLFEAWNEVAKQWGEGHSEMWQKLWESSDYLKDSFIWYLPNYVYIPETPRLKDDEMRYGIWDMMYIIPDKQKEFYDTLKELLALVKAKNISDNIYSYSGSWGMENPVHIGVIGGKDAGDFWSNNRKMWEALGEEAGPLWRKMVSLLKKREFRQFWYNPGLSYYPE
jgi:hypothetical protein